MNEICLVNPQYICFEMSSNVKGAHGLQLWHGTDLFSYALHTGAQLCDVNPFNICCTVHMSCERTANQ